MNSGNANCATGRPGIQACQRVCGELGDLLNVPATAVFPSSTGIIGVRFPVDKVIARLADLTALRKPTEQGVTSFAQAIMTTDTRLKLAGATFLSAGKTVNIAGVAKGAGMIHPQLATMLVYLFTDIAASPKELNSVLRDACDDSFNSISIDGDTSTNDTVLLLASGQSGVQFTSHSAGLVKNGFVAKQFLNGLRQVCQSLAAQIVSDGEGVQHVIQLSVEQARDKAEARQIARTVAHSLLVKTAWAGADPNWGRILAAVGRSGIAVDPAGISIMIGDQLVCRGGAACDFDEKRAHQDLAQPSSKIRIRLRRGRSSSVFLATDLTAEYVRINADYST